MKETSLRSNHSATRWERDKINIQRKLNVSKFLMDDVKEKRNNEEEEVKVKVKKNINQLKSIMSKKKERFRRYKRKENKCAP